MDKDISKEMFGTSKPPRIELSLENISQTAQELTGRMSISGVQPKLSVKLDKEKGLLVPTAHGGEYILKPQTLTLPYIPENEECCMTIASHFGIEVPLHCLIELKDNSLAYVVQRFDRYGGVKRHQEDFAQMLNIGTDKKYFGSVEQAAKRLKEVSVAPGLDVQLFFARVVFNFIIGNGDAHLKNYSILYMDDQSIRLAPAYDIVCSKLVISQEADSALMINGKGDKLKREDFDKLADYLNIPIKIRYEKYADALNSIKSFVDRSRIKEEAQKKFIQIVQDRLIRLELA